MNGYRTCPDCGGDLVDVDNPFRREVRHRRGAPECVPLTPEQREARDRALADLVANMEIIMTPDATIRSYFPPASRSTEAGG